MKKDYFVTWTSQKDAIQIPVLETTEQYYLLNDGSPLYDLSSCSYHQSFGLKNKFIQDAIKNQIDELPLLGPKFSFPLKDKVSKNLLAKLKLSGKIFYTTSGSESVENALKVARDKTGKDYILRRENSYHGATLGSLSVTGDWRSQNMTSLSDLSISIPEPFEKDALKNTEKTIKDNLDKGIAALIVETITGGNGVIVPSKEWFLGIEKLCKQYDILLILDEVVCGFARTGKDFGFHHYGISPNIICLSKAISGGFIPFGAVYCDDSISSFYEDHKLKCGLTNYAHPLGLRALDAILDTLDSTQFKTNLENRIKVLDSFLNKVNTLEKVKETRSIGLLAAVEFHENKTPSFKELIEKGIFINIIGNNMIFAPFLIGEVDILESTLNELLNHLNI